MGNHKQALAGWLNDDVWDAACKAPAAAFKISDIVVPEHKPVYDAKDPEVAAKRTGEQVVAPAKNELQIDLDTNEQFVRFKEGLDMLMQLGVKCSYKLTGSKSPGHKHATVVMDIDIENPFERIALQAALGSDPRREIYSWERARLTKHLPTVFFEKQEKPSGQGGIMIADNSNAFSFGTLSADSPF